MSDLGSATHLDAEFRRLLAFGEQVGHPRGGAAWLGDDGTPQLDRPVHTYITARMAHVSPSVPGRRGGGSWFHQLDRSNRPAASVWSGKPDLYHVVQATLLPRLPAAPGLAVALREGLLGPAPID